MTRILFLHGARDRLQAAAGWLADASREGRRVIVYAPEEAALAQLDGMLWTHPPTGFTAHCRSGSPLAAETPIVLSPTLEACGHEECVMNLSNQVPPGFAKFDQLVEVVGTTEDCLLPGRERFRFYRDRGYPLEAQDLSAQQA